MRGIGRSYLPSPEDVGCVERLLAVVDTGVDVLDGIARSRLTRRPSALSRGHSSLSWIGLTA